MKEAAIVLFIVAVLGYFMFSEPTENEYKFKDPITRYTVVVKQLNTMDDVDKEYRRVWELQKHPIIKFEKGERYGFSYKSNDICFVVMAKEDRYTLRELEITLGHEHLHCMYGAWHA